MKLLILVALAGVAGTLLRFFCTKAAGALFPGFPWGTLAVNVIGAFLAGFLFALCHAKFQEYEVYFPVIFIGFLGAFTTFSTFALESGRFLLDGQYAKFIWNILLQNGTGLPSAVAGLLLGRHLF